MHLLLQALLASLLVVAPLVLIDMRRDAGRRPSPRLRRNLIRPRAFRSIWTTARDLIKRRGSGTAAAFGDWRLHG
jgi:hypothetical protein